MYNVILVVKGKISYLCVSLTVTLLTHAHVEVKYAQHVLRYCIRVNLGINMRSAHYIFVNLVSPSKGDNLFLLSFVSAAGRDL